MVIKITSWKCAAPDPQTTIKYHCFNALRTRRCASLAGCPEPDTYHEIEMRKNDIAHRLARVAHVSKSEAADRIDAIVHRIVKNLRRGDEPGSGELAQLIAKAQKPAPARRNGTSSK